MEEHFAVCQRLGFSVMEIGIGGAQTGRLPERMSEQEIKRFKALRDHYAIATPFCCIENDFTLADASAHDAMVQRVLPQIELAASLDATHVRLFAGFTPAAEMTDDTWRRLLEAVHRCSDLCESLGLSIALETHGQITQAPDGSAVHAHTVTTDPASLRRLMGELPANVGFNYDPGNLKAVAPEDRTYLLDLLDARINYCHLKDWRRQGAGWTAVAPGEDDLDYGELLSRMSYDGVYLIEYEPTGDVEDGIRRGLAYLQGLDLEVELVDGIRV